MSLLSSFHEVRFPTDLALGATGGPERRTEIVTLGSGKEQRNTRWANSRRSYNAGYGIKTVDDLYAVIAFFEERRGRLYGFRFRDPLDFKSSSPGSMVSPLDQEIGTGNGTQSIFQLQKRYGDEETGYVRAIAKPVSGSVAVAVNGITVSQSSYSVNSASGEVDFLPSAIPASSMLVTAGFEFDVPVRFDADNISVNLGNFDVGDIPSIPLVELLV